MATSTKDILKFLNGKFPVQEGTIQIRHCAESRIGLQQGLFHQFVLGVTDADEFSNGIDHYRRRMLEKLNAMNLLGVCYPWPFKSHEHEEMKIVLDELAEEFGVTLDADEMIKSLKSDDHVRTQYVVVTVVEYSIAYIE